MMTKFNNKTIMRIIIVSIFTMITFVIFTKVIYDCKETAYNSDINNYYVEEYSVKDGDTLWGISSEIIEKEKLHISIKSYNSLLYKINEGNDVFTYEGFLKSGKILKVLKLK